MADRVFIEGVRFHGFHGLTRMEREIGVRYAVDVEMHADLRAAGRSDKIGDTIDYRRVHERVVSIGRNESFRLIETLADRIAEAILAEFNVLEVRVRVRKETPVLDGIVDCVGVEMTRAAAGRQADAEPKPSTRTAPANGSGPAGASSPQAAVTASGGAPTTVGSPSRRR